MIVAVLLGLIGPPRCCLIGPQQNLAAILADRAAVFALLPDVWAYISTLHMGLRPYGHQ